MTRQGGHVTRVELTSFLREFRRRSSVELKSLKIDHPNLTFQLGNGVSEIF